MNLNADPITDIDESKIRTKTTTTTKVNLQSLFEYDRAMGIKLLCGVDEAGRGSLVGDVYAAAVILPPDCDIVGINDSKKLTPKKREALFEEITTKALCYCVATASLEEIEEINILNATILAMQRAVQGLSIRPLLVLVDGNRNIKLEGIHSRFLEKGDTHSACIAAASILAKVSRDRYITELAKSYPSYHLERNKGYGTEQHYEMLRAIGPAPIHRPSFLKSMNNTKNNPWKRRGEKGEQVTCEYLEGKGYAILFRNFSCRFGEIDIITANERYICFVEVKSLKANSMILPREQVGVKKQERLRKAAYCWLENNKSELQPRFDVAEVLLSGNGSGNDVSAIVTEYLENAF